MFDAHIHYGDPMMMRQIVEKSRLKSDFPCYNTVQFDPMNCYESVHLAHGITAAAFVPFVFREVDKTAESLATMAYAAAHNGYAYGLLDEDNIGFVQGHFREIVGLKEHIVLHKTQLTEGKREIFHQMSHHQLTLLLHSQAAPRVDYVKTLLANFPHMKIQIAHMGCNKNREDLAFMEDVWRQLQSYEQVCFDTSTTRNPVILERAVEILGSDRILFGSDFPFFMDQEGTEDIVLAQLQQIQLAKIPHSVKDKILTINYKNYIKKGV